MRLRIGHSPDPDDAFMAWALAEGVVRDPAFEVEIVPRDIETLNEWALDGRGLDVSAMSLATFAQVTDEYVLLPFGASFGEGYGPVVVAAQPLTPEDLRSLHVASPGPFTTATNALRLAVGEIPNLEHVPFTDILPGVKHGLYDAGLLIHEGQITYGREGLEKVLDLGEWWAREEPGLPFPLGVVAIRRDVGEDLVPRAVALVKRALDAALENRETALAYASKFARGLAADDVDRFVRMYVSDLTIDMRPRGAEAIRRFIQRMLHAGLIEPGARFEFAPEAEMPNPATLARLEAQAPAAQADEPPVAHAVGPSAAPPVPRAPPAPAAAVAIAAPLDPPAPPPKALANRAATKGARAKAPTKAPAKATKRAAKAPARKGASPSARKAAKAPAKKATKKAAKAPAARKTPARKAAKAPAKRAKKPARKPATKPAKRGRRGA